MKRAKILSLTLLATILLSAGAFIALSAAPWGRVRITVRWSPSTYCLDAPVPDPWKAELYSRTRRGRGGRGGRGRVTIDPSTLLLEGIYTPVSTRRTRRGLRAYFNGYEVKDALIAKIPHMGPGIYRVGLEITGELTDGTAFSSTGYIYVTVSEPPPP